MTIHNREQSNKLIQSMIDNVKRHQTKLQDSIQLCAVQILCHAYHFGDYRKANDLVSVLGNGIRASNLVKWFEEFGGLTKDAKGFNGWKGKDYIKENLERAKKTPWHAMMPKENPFKGFNLEGEVKKLLTKYKEVQNNMAVYSEEEKKKINLSVNDNLIQELLSIVKFEVLVEDEIERLEEHLTSNDEKALEV